MRSPARTSRVVAAGAVVVAIYLLTALVTVRSGMLPVRPLYDGTAPPSPYRWVEPPEGFMHENLEPQGGTGTVSLTPEGSEPGTATTQDGQALVIMQRGTFAARDGQTAVRVRIEPLAPQDVGRAPAGLDYDSNAYRITATYVPSGEDAPIVAERCEGGAPCPSVVLRYAFGATALYRREASRWIEVPNAVSTRGALQVFAQTPRLGTFVAVAPAVPEPARNYWPYIGAVLGAAALAAALALSRRPGVRRWWRRVKRELRR